MGSFSTEEQRKWDDPKPTAQKDFQLTPPIPAIAWGLSIIDMKKGTNQRVHIYADNLKPDGFQIHVDTWGDTTLYRAATNWFYPGDCDYQVGAFSTLEDHSIDENKQQTTKKVKFSRPYPAPPNVVVWLTAFDIEKGNNIRIRTYADNVTADGFDLHTDTWSNTRLFSAKSCWIAYPTGKQGVTSGTYSTLDVRGTNPNQMENSKKIDFTSGGFKDAPTVVTGITALDFDKSNNVRMKLSEDAITNTGFTWHINSWSDSVFYSGRAAYIAFETPK
ncbi:MAG: hypothetical protein Q9187_002109 [Circinaria calcarea]